jgi:Pentapeptide repeats (8 copies)
MQVYVRSDRPEPWQECRKRVRHRWVLPFVMLEYGLDWVAYALSSWRLLEVLEYLGRFGVLVAVIFYFAESGDRVKQRHYQAWQVVDLAEGKGGNGGRIEALEELNRDGVSLIGVNLQSAFLMGIRLPKAKLARANFNAADARNADLTGANLRDANLQSANFRGARLEAVSFAGSTLNDADLTGANLTNTDLAGATLENADLRDVDMAGANWGALQSIKGANVHGVKNAHEFVEWALRNGAVNKAGD